MLSKLLKRSSTHKISDRDAYYDALASKFSDSALASGWINSHTQYSRFQVLSMMSDFTDASVLDVGCGVGTFVDYLDQENLTCDYMGIDSSSKMIETARERYPNHVFKQVDFLDDDFFISSDYVIASGLLSYRVSDPNAYLESSIYKLFKMSSKGLAFNCLSTVNEESSRLMSFDPSDVFDLCRQWTPYVSLHHHYLLNDFTVYMYPFHH